MAKKNKKVDFTFTVKSVGEAGEFEGCGNAYGVVDCYGSTLDAGVFGKSIAERKGKIRMLWNHNSDEVIGKYVDIVENEAGLFVRGQLALTTQRGRETYELLKMGAIDSFSVGFQPLRSEFNKETGVEHYTEGRLLEVSIVTFPANEESTLTDIKSSEYESAFDRLTEENKVKALTYINNLKTSPADAAAPEDQLVQVDTNHSEDKHADTEQADTPLSSELKHLLEQLQTAMTV